jgi:hypothetical protein
MGIVEVILHPNFCNASSQLRVGVIKTDQAMRSFIYSLFLFLFSVHHSWAQAGAIDPSFNPSDMGFAIGEGPNGYLRARAEQNDGRLISGESFSSFIGDPDTMVARGRPDGTVDESYTSPQAVCCPETSNLQNAHYNPQLAPVRNASLHGDTGIWMSSIVQLDGLGDGENAVVRLWLDTLFSGVLSGRLVAYEINGNMKNVISAEEVRNMLHRVDSMYTEDIATGEMKLEVTKLDREPKDVVAIGFRERVSGLSGTGVIKRVEAFAPFVAVYDDYGEYVGKRPLFWVKATH